MVIQCPECQARFKMADEKARNGVKVRCSRCKHVFPVQLDGPSETVSPSEEEAPMASAAATAAVGSVAPTSFTTNEVFFREEADDAPSFSPPAEAPAAAPAATTGIDGFDLADFSIDTEEPAGAATAVNTDELDLGEFNLEAAPKTIDDDAAADDFSFDSDLPANEFSFAAGEEKESSDFAAPPAAEDFSFESNVAEDFSFENNATGEFSFENNAADDFSFDQEPASEFGSETPADGTDEMGSSAVADEFSFGDFSPEAAFAIDPPQPAASDAASSWSAGEGSSGEFDFAPPPSPGGADEFDFSNLSFGDESPASPAPPLSPAVSEVLPPLAAPAPLTEVSAPAVPKEPSAASSPAHHDEPLFVPPPPPRKSALSGARGLLLLLLLLIGGGAAYVFLQGGVPDLSSLIARLSGAAPPAPVSGQIRLSDLNGYYINNAEAGQLFVIHGKVTNDYPETRSAIAVKGTLYNQAGKALMQQTVFSGNKLDENALRTLPFAKLEESMNNQFGDSLSNLNVAPGKSLPFTIVFRNLPTGLAEFTAEVTDSKPGAS